MVSPQDQRSPAPVPSGFGQELRDASANRQAAKLILLSFEVQGALWESSAMALIDQALLGIQPGRIWERVVLFTGHRVDSSDRDTPRFPPVKEQVAREAIRHALEEQQKATKDSILGIAGGANGGDLLFLEVCDELGISTEMRLALPRDQYVKASVENGNGRWVERFATQLAKHCDVPILAESPDLPSWLQVKKNYDIWQRNNLWLLSDALSHGARHRALIALWDGESGDAPGGTEHMVSLAEAREMQFVWLDTKQLFGLAGR
jgi:hypothetical protein